MCLNSFCAPEMIAGLYASKGVEMVYEITFPATGE